MVLTPLKNFGPNIDQGLDFNFNDETNQEEMRSQIIFQVEN